MKRLYIGFIFIGMLTGCATPRTAPEFRESVKKYTTAVHNYEIDKSYSNVSKTIIKQSKKCLNAKVKVTQCDQFRCREYFDMYESKIISAKNKTEVHVLNWYKHKGIKVKEENKLYKAVIDVVPIGKRKTKVTAYAAGIINTAVEQWSKGSNLGCPDLAAR